MNAFAWAAARNVGEAAESATSTVADAMCAANLPEGEAALSVVKAGGIDLLDLLKEGLVTPATLISLGAIPELARIEEQADGGVRIGAMVTLSQLAEHPLVRRRYPALADAAGRSASPQIRHVATLGGNLLQRPRCWYFRAAEFHCLRKGGGHCFAIEGENQYHAIFDNRTCAIVHPSTAATVLVAVGAAVELTDAHDGKRQLVLADFLVAPAQDVQRENDLQPHEILTAVVLPALSRRARTAHVKQGQKDSFDWPLADVAVVIELDEDGICRDATIVLGAAAPVPHRARAAEASLVGRRPSESVLAEVAHAALDGATPLGRNGYKTTLFETLVRRAIAQAVGAVDPA